MPSQSLLGSVAIGKDTSGNFKLSPYGLAVRSGADGRFVTRHKGQLVDVNDLTIDGTDAMVYRVPKRRPAPGKDIIILSDNPFSALFVEDVDDNGTVKGVDLTGKIQVIRPVVSLLTQALTEHSGAHYFVTAAGPDSLFKGGGGSDLMPLLMLSGQTPSGTQGDPLSTLLMMRALGQRELDDTGIALLAMLKGGNQTGTGSDQLSLLLALQAGDLFSEHEAKPHSGKK